jgi:hypothetical protein
MVSFVAGSYAIAGMYLFPGAFDNRGCQVFENPVVDPWMKVNWSATTTGLVPMGVVTVTSTDPVPGGDMAET